MPHHDHDISSLTVLLFSSECTILRFKITFRQLDVLGLYNIHLAVDLFGRKLSGNLVTVGEVALQT